MASFASAHVSAAHKTIVPWSVISHPYIFFIPEIILRVMLRDYWEEQFLSQKKKM